MFNYCAGPAMLPESVKQQIQQGWQDWHNGMSVVECNHRGPAIKELYQQMQTDIRELLSIPDEYHVLFMSGGARLQFAMIPLNLLGGDRNAEYLITGHWSRQAYQEAKITHPVAIACSTEDNNFTTLPHYSEMNLSNQATYFHYTDNETIHGVEFPEPPMISNNWLVSDMSSNLLSRPVDVSRFGLIYACAQKNLGIAGLTVVIINPKLVRELSDVPKYFSYQTWVESNSMYNTPDTMSWYVASKVMKWIKAEGGLTAMDELNQAKSKKLYEFIDSSDFYHNPVQAEHRSRLNVPFTLKDEHHEQAFLTDAFQAGLMQLEGHRSVGGMRASLYNAMPMAGVEALISFMEAFAKKH